MFVFIFFFSLSPSSYREDLEQMNFFFANLFLLLKITLLMSSPTRSISSRLPGRHDPDSSLTSVTSPQSSRDSRISSIIPETSVVSPRSTTFSRSGLEDNIHSLQSKSFLSYTPVRKN